MVTSSLEQHVYLSTPLSRPTPKLPLSINDPQECNEILSKLL